MAITTQERTNILKLAAGLFNAAPGAQNLSDFIGAYEALGNDLQALSETLVSTTAFAVLYPNTLTLEEKVGQFLNNLGLKGNADAQDFVLGKLNAGESEGSVLLQALAAIDDYQGGDAAIIAAKGQLANKATVAEYYSVGAPTGVGQSSDSLEVLQGAVAGVTTDAATVTVAKAAIDESLKAGAKYLSVQQDNLSGTIGNDLFIAKVAQNASGEQANTLGTGDSINGGAGSDTLQATVQAASALNAGPSSAIRPITKSVENIEITALSATSGSEAVVIDAAELKGVTKIGSVQSNADLLIQNLTTRTNDSGDGVKDTDYANRKVTESVTIVYDHAGNNTAVDGASDLTVLFDNDYLVCGQDLTSQANFFLLDQDAELQILTGKRPNKFPDRVLNNDERLADINVNGLRFKVDGKEYAIEMTDEQRIEATTHQEYVNVLKAILVAKQASGELPAGLTLELDTTLAYGEPVAVEGGTYSRPIPAFVLRADGSVVEYVGFVNSSNAPGDFDVFGRGGDGVESECKVTSTIELEKVGRDGEGGVLTIGGMAGQDNGLTNVWNGTQHSQNQGVERFNITVSGDKTQNSSLAALQSTNNTLQEVNIKSAAGSEADLKIGNGNTVGAITNALKDVQTFNATEFVNDLTLNAHLSAEVVAKYLDRVDTQPNAEQDNVTFSYNFGQGNDTLNLNISKANLEAAGNATREDFVLNVDTGAGNDTVHVEIGDGIGGKDAHWFINNDLNKNLAINTGAGDDEVVVHGSGTWNVNLGTGSDRVYLADSERSSNKASQAVWVFNTADQVTALADARVLENLESGANTTYTSLLGTSLQVNFRGITKAVKLDAGVNTRLELNQAIKEAINKDAVLAQLLEAADGPANTLAVHSYIDGAVAATDLSVRLTAPVALSASELAQYNQANGGTAVDAATALAQISAQVAAINASNAYASALANNGVANLAGQGSQHAGNSVVTLNVDGNDVVVLSANDFNNEIVRLEQATGNNKVTVVNLESADDQIQVKGANGDWIAAGYATKDASGAWVLSDLAAAAVPANTVYAGYWAAGQFQYVGAEIDVVLAGAYVPQPGQQTSVTVVDLEPYDASTGAFKYILDYAKTGAKMAEIFGFGADDTIEIVNAPAGSELTLEGLATTLGFSYGLSDSSNVWGITLYDLDPALVSQVVAAPTTGAKVSELNKAWGSDWLVVPAAPVTQVTVSLNDTLDASTGAFVYLLDFTEVGGKAANIKGFGADDTIKIINAPANSDLDVQLLAPKQPADLGLVYGTDDLANTWAINLQAVDETLVDNVQAAVNTAAQVEVLNTAWGNDWLVA